MMHLVMEGPTTEKLIEEVQQVMVQDSTDIAMLNMEFNDLCNKV